MADNIAVTPGAGATVASDDVGGVHYQIIKPAFGAADSATLVSTANPLPVQEAPGATSATSNVSASTSVQTLLASNANRYGAMVYNDSTSNLYVKLGSAASSSSFSVLLMAGQLYELGFRYTGIITGLWVTATGAARVTEVTA